MSHRLLHTLVFASTSLLACGGQVDEVADPDGAPNASPPDASKHDASSPDATEPEAAPPIDAGSDVRTCEGGWPTTKGAICTFDAGIVCCKESFGDAGPICCEQSP